MTNIDNLQKTINEWKVSQIDETLKKELMEMSDEELLDAFYKDLEFGTGGMRGIVGVGTNRMNIYTLRKANYGYACYLKGVSKKALSVVIAYDCRNMSLEFAKESACVLAHYGIKVYLFNKITPTPELSFAVRYLKASGGIVVTASHNPPKYNGYKIYDADGCQLIPELADIVIKNIENAPNPLTMELESFEALEKEGKVVWLDENIDDEYLKCVKSISVNEVNKDNFKVCFTPLHGTSYILGPKLLQEMGYKYTLTAEQMIPDPKFSTLILPNPEDKKAFDLSIKYAKENNCDICIATDPDADRVGLAVKDKNGEYVLLTGNQTGALLIYYLCNYRKVDKKGVIFNTIVTSPLGVKIGDSFGLEHYSTLTGFKFIGEQAKKLENNSEKMFYFGYEESYGYVIKDFVRDKDSLQALLLCSEMACFYKNQGKSLLDVLEEVYQKYGYYVEDLVNINLEGLDGARRIERILNKFRELKDIEGLSISAKEDYQLSTKLDYKTLEVDKLDLPKSNVIKYFLEDGGFFVLRPSGTEPKMKLYISVASDSKEESIKKKELIKETIMKIIDMVE